MSRSDDDRLNDIIEACTTRILLTPHYHRVDLNQVWVMATVDVPQLLNQLDPASRGGG